MNDFGFQISRPRSINLDQTDSTLRERLLEAVPSYRLCIGCGGCTATCSAGQFTTFNIRRIHHAFANGQTDGLAQQLDNCMLCGKCMLVCPRGVNLRRLIIAMRQLLNTSDN